MRSEVGQVLVDLPQQNWEQLISSLYQDKHEDALRLAIELISHLNYEYVSDQLVAKVIVAYAKSGSRMVGIFMPLEYEYPPNRIDSLLNKVAEIIKSLDSKWTRCIEYSQLSGCVYHLIVRKITSVEELNPVQLLDWLKNFGPFRGYRDEDKKTLDGFIKNNDLLRRSIQRQALLENSDQSIGERNYRLCDLSRSFIPSNEDVITLLNSLEPELCTTENVKDIVLLVSHDRQNGHDVRNVARQLLGQQPDHLEWLENLTKPQELPEWEIKRIEQEEQWEEEKKQRLIEERDFCLLHVEDMKEGCWGVLYNPASAYLNAFGDLDSQLPPHDRLVSWLGEDLTETALIGAETFLKLEPPSLRVIDIVEALLEQKTWDAAPVIIVALAERHRKNIGFDDLPDERLMVGIFHLWFTGVTKLAGIESLDKALEYELKKRGVWEQTVRHYCEPQFNANRSQINHLYYFMREDVANHVSTRLALEWLGQFPDISIETQQEMLHCALHSEGLDELTGIVRQRLTYPYQDKDFKHLWQAVGIVVDFQKTIKLLPLDTTDIEPELLWSLKDLTSERFSNKHPIRLSVVQIEWIIDTFRLHYPYARHPIGTTYGGNRNAWDASEYITHLIQSLGNFIDDDAKVALIRLKDTKTDGYTGILKRVYAEHVEKQVDAVYKPCTLINIKAILQDQIPTTAGDLQAFMFDALVDVQNKIKSDDVESWRGFYDDQGVPYQEERCRDHLLILLRNESSGIVLEPETHIAADKEVDITCSVAPSIRLPIEVKGQWHPDLWHAADTQLDRWYTPDWRAEKRGIYLVFWFGSNAKGNKKLKSPGKGKIKPKMPEKLRDMLESSSTAAQSGRVKIFVLDLERG